MEIGPNNTIECCRTWHHADGRRRTMQRPIDLQLRAKRARMLPGFEEAQP
jgi:hypothetical protein